MAPLFFETVPGPAAVDLDPIMTHTCTHARSRTHTQTHGSWLSQREKLEARLLYRDYLSFDSCCSTSKTAAERSKNEKNDIFGVCMGLVGSTVAGRKAIPRSLARFRDFERPEHAPRSPAGTHTCVVVYRRVPCVPRSREREKDPRAPEKSLQMSIKSAFGTS